MGAAPRAASCLGCASPGIFKALSYHELITGCVAAASSSIYVISCFAAFALLLIYTRQLLTPNNLGGCPGLGGEGRDHSRSWGWQPTGSGAGEHLPSPAAMLRQDLPPLKGALLAFTRQTQHQAGTTQGSGTPNAP